MPAAVSCPQCGASNPTDQRFCGSCGHALTLLCPGCGAANPPSYAFCGTCGTALRGSAPAPPSRAEVPDRHREERRLATVVFADLSGFTSLSERMDPEDVKALATDLTARMGVEVERFGGTVVSVMGDAVMAVFGAPVTHEDDAERAVRAALSMLDSIRHERETGLPLELHIGVNTGEVMAGLVGPPERREYTVMGDVTNTAARLQSAAPPGTILVGRRTYEATRHAIEYETVEPVTAKGKEEPVQAWRATGTVAGPAERPSTVGPLVGRDRELDLLVTLSEEVIEERRPRLVTLLGPPGIGKSRLIRELTARMEGRGRLLKGRCLPYGETTGYDALGQQVKELAGVAQSDPLPVARSRVQRLAARVVPPEEADEVGAHLQILLGLSSGSTPDRQVLYASARRFAEGLARETPTALVFEDLHWAQPALLDLLETIAARARDVPLLLLASARPELLDSRPTWGGGQAHYTAINLAPLSEDHGIELARTLLGAERGPDVAADLVHAGGGNPLFIEELAATVAEGSVGTLPTSVQAIIAARLDALPAEERRVLQEASIVGRFFWRGALLAVSEDGETIDATLDRLEARDLIRRQPQSRLAGDREFVFKHILTQEVAYAALPKATRRRGHAAAAQYLEGAMGERARDSASILAHHWREAGDRTRATQYLLTAADVASRAWAKQEAISLYSEVLALVGESDRAVRAEAALARANTRLDAGDLTGALEELDALIPELEGRERVLALLARTTAWYWLTNAERIRVHGEEAVRAAREIGDPELEARALSVLSEAAGMEGDTARSVELIRQAVQEWPRSAVDAGYASAVSQAAIAHYWRGEHEQCIELGSEGHRIGLEVSSIPAVVNGAAHVAVGLAGMSRHEEALEWLDRAITFGRDMELVPRLTGRCLNMAAGTLRELGELERARELNEEALALAQKSSFPGAEVSAQIDLVFLDLLEGHVGRARGQLPDLLAAAERTKGWHQWLWMVRLLTARAETELASGEPEAAAATAEEAIRRTQGPNRLKYACRAGTALGSALLELGRATDAVAALGRAADVADRLGHAPSRWAALGALSRAAGAAGRDEEAEASAERARRVFEEFAAGLSEEHRATLSRHVASSPLAPILGA